MSDQKNDIQLPINEDEFKKVMENLQSSNSGQERYARKQYQMGMISALCSICVLAIVIYILVTVLPKVNSILDDIQVSVADIQVITSNLAEVDYNNMVNDIDQLVNTSETSIVEAMEKLNSVDFEKLNDAITELESVVKPLARLFGR